MIAALLLVAGQVAPIAARPLPDRVLAAQRGGFRLPNGVDVAMTVQTDTAVNGALVLRTIFRADQGTPTTTVYTPRDGVTVAAPTTSGSINGSPTAPTISYDPVSGIQVSARGGAPGLSVTTAAGATGPAMAGLEAVDAQGAGVATDAGTVTQHEAGGLNVVRLAAADLTITHLTGAAFGAAIANSGSDRAIDTQTSVAIDLSHAGPDVVGSALLRAQDLAIDVTAMRMR